MNPELIREITSAVTAAVVSSLADQRTAVAAEVTPPVPIPTVVSPRRPPTTEDQDDFRTQTDEEEQLKLFASLKLPIAEMARRLHVTRPTIYSMLEKYNLQHSCKYSVITEGDLDQKVRAIKQQHPAAGQVIVQGHLVAQGINIQRRRLRASLAREDRLGIHMRRLHTVRRRVYSVPGPNFLWHIDGTHKLIRWKMVVHAGIDGYSRLLLFAQCSNNNRAQTVLTLFEEARQRYGTPLRVRTDEGGENVRVWDAMNVLHAVETNPVIVGSSVHNQRIERAHRDLNEQVINRYYNLFCELEQNELLNPENSTDLFCLHHVYIPHINRSLSEFVLAHNNHKISTAGNYSPLQLFLLNYYIWQGHSRADPNFHGGIALSALDRTNLQHVRISPLAHPLTEEQQRQLVLAVDSLNIDDTRAAYRQTAMFVADCLRN